MTRLAWGVLASVLICCAAVRSDDDGARKVAGEKEAGEKEAGEKEKGEKTMQLGNFSVSLTVKDLATSRAFYEKLGFHVSGGNGTNYSIMQNATATIGLYQGMFDENILTFNPGWDRNKATLPEFDDVREIQRKLKAQGLTLATEADESTSEPAHIVLMDPDGNQILIDQHVPKPGN